jgi:uncharacterized membrane protein YbhN (UPF0104 family)
VTTVDSIETEPVTARPRPAVGTRWWRRLRMVPTPALFVLVAAVATIILWRKGALEDVGPALRTLPPQRVIVILVVYALSILALAIRWHVLARMAGGTPEWTSSAEVFLTSVIVNYAAPIGLAVPTRAALTVRDLRLSPLASSAVVGWELVLDCVALTTISAGWLALGGVTRLGVLSAGPKVVVILAAIVLAIVLTAAVASRVSPTVRRLAGSAIQMVQLPMRRPGKMIVAICLTAIFWSVQSGVMAALIGSFGVTPSPGLLLCVMGLPILIGMLSPVPGGAGVRESLMATAAGLQGVATAPILLAAIVYRLALFAVTPAVWCGLRLARALSRGR